MVLAHVFFNVALVARLLLQGWLAIPAEQFRLAAQLGFAPRDVFRRIELPMLRDVLPGAFVLVFLLCMTSFAVALILGGGPRATTVELAIYQALRFDFDLGRAAWLALIQFALCGTVAVLALRLSAAAGFGGGLGGSVRRWDADRPALRALDAAGSPSSAFPRPAARRGRRPRPAGAGGAAGLGLVRHGAQPRRRPRLRGAGAGARPGTRGAHRRAAAKAAAAGSRRRG